MFNWISTSEDVPKVNQDDEWDKLFGVSKKILTYSKECGIQFGIYIPLNNFWKLDNVIYTIEVDYWMEITKPEGEK